jgi:hypothetical protein
MGLDSTLLKGIIPMQCPICKTEDAVGVHSLKRRNVKGINRSYEFLITIYVCRRCEKYFNSEDYQNIAPKGCSHAWEVIDAAMDIYDDYGGKNIVVAARKLSRICGYEVAPTTMYGWWKRYSYEKGKRA